MKKMLCILFSVLMIMSALSPAAVFAAEIEDSITAEEFVNGVENIMFEPQDFNEEFPDEKLFDESVKSDFDTCKLIVKSTKKINTDTAADVVSGYNDLWILKYNTPAETEAAFNYYSSLDTVDYVEPDRILDALSSAEVSEAPEKTYTSWGAEYIGLDVYNNSIISSNITPANTVVAVLDTGAQSDHPAFNGRVIPTGVNTSTSGERNSCEDDNGHGTQVSGVIIDSTLDNVTVRPYKVLDKYGQGTLITLAAGIISAVADGVDIINMSITFAESSEVLKEAIMLAERSNIVLIASSGNDSSNTVFYPASYDGVIKIGAVNESGVLANFSTRGEDIDFAAPGVNIYTTTIGSNYKNVSGTSFASPLVAALCATMLSTNPALSSEDIYKQLVESCISVQESDAKLKYGNGILYSPAFRDPSNPLSKTQAPYFSHETAIYKENIELEIFCDTPGAVIYYTTDRSVPSKTNPAAIIYDGNPIRISQTAVITAVAYCEGSYRSSIVNFASIIAPVLSEELFEIDAAGTITAFSGAQASFTVPDTVNGITVTAIGPNVFNGLNISEIFLPVSVKSIGAGAFDGCPMLKTVSAKGVTTIGERAFYNCTRLKNIYIDEIISIGKYAFYSVCSLHYELNGVTFSLNFEKTRTISEGAFQYSAISNIDLVDAGQIGKAAFLGCSGLVSVHAQNLSSVSNEAFKNCTSLRCVKIYGLSSIAVSTFSGCKALEDVAIPDASIVLTKAFENCTTLEEITLENAQTVYSAAFTGCNSLRIIVLPSFTSFESAIYNAGTTTYPKFSSSLQAFIAPMLTKTSAYMFSSAPNILAVSFKTLSSVADYTFSGCKKMMYLNIENVTQVSKLAFANSEIDFIDARNLITAEALPDNSGIMLSNKFVQATSEASNLIVYGTAGTAAESFANEKGYEFRAIPYIYEEIPKYITEISGTVTVRAAGFNLTYQWYSNSVNSNVGGTPIEGATSETYTFTQKDAAYYYYCVITQDDFGIITEYATDVIIKDPKPANYFFYNAAVEEARRLNPLIYVNFEIVEKALSVNVSGLRSCEQKLVDIQTAAIRAAVAKLVYRKVTSATLSASKRELHILQAEKIKVHTNPTNSVYSKIEWLSDNTDAFVVSKAGRVRCVGRGSAYIIARIINHDGSVVIERIKFKSSSTSWFAEFFAMLFKNIFILFNKQNI